MKVEIDFPARFETNEVAWIPIGRLHIQGGTVRIGFGPDGHLHLLVPQSALDQGGVVVWNDKELEDGPLGFGLPPKKTDG